MTTIKFRRDTSANWTSVNPIPAQGEPCYETDTGKLKIGNGSDNYAALPYVSDGGGSSGDLPIATATTLGGIKVGNNLSITADGTLSATGGSAGTSDYTELTNKPQINSVELSGNKTLNDLGIQPKGNYQPAGNYAAEVHTHTKADITDFPAIPSKTSDLTNDSGFITSVPVASSTVSGTVKVGSGLSINNGILSAKAQKIDVDSALSSTSTNPVQNKVVNNALEGKQDTISDLATIRSNASAGKTASDTIATYGNIVTHNASEFQPAGDYATTADIPTKTSELTNDSGFLTEAPTNMVTTDTDQTISGVKTFTKRIESGNNINMGGAANVTLNGGALVINQSTTGDTYPSKIFKESNCITIKNGTPNTITSSDFFAIVDRSNNKVLSVNTATGVRFTNNSGNSYILLTSNDLSNHIDTNYLKWDNETEKITIKKDAVAHLAMPSDTKVDLTLGANGTSYTAPADGYVTLNITSTASGQRIGLYGDYKTNIYSSATSQPLMTSIPVSSDRPVMVRYDSSGPVNEFSFHYCNGTVPTNT